MRERPYKPTPKMEYTVYTILKELREKNQVRKPVPEVYIRYLRLLLPDCLVGITGRWYDRGLIWVSIKRKAPIE
jgi:hypothetical protein